MSKFSKAQAIPVDIKNKLSEYPELLRTLLYNRGIDDRETAKLFLNPDYERDVHDPFLLSDMEVAAKRILSAIENKEQIVIYADYDADGIPGAVILHDFFTKIGYKNFDIYLPHRHEEGYGFHVAAIDELLKKKTDLIITVDVGISEVDSVRYAAEQGIDVIVTDHHEVGTEIPPALAVVNPKLGDYPDRMICGAAVAWKLVVALLRKGTFEIPEGWEKWLLDMVGVATISDMVPLLGENRTLAHFGLRVLQKSRRPGLIHLLKKIQVNQKNITEDDISFMITPRINAASRMSHPMEAFKVLAAKDTQASVEAVEHLIAINDERKTLVAQTVKKASAVLKKREIHEVIVVGSPDWQLGILGLVATKITEKFERPTFVWGKEGDLIKGSCRGSNGVSVVEIMQGAHELLVQFGGHKGAGGFSATPEHIHFLEEKFIEIYRDIKTDETELQEEAIVDTVLSLNEVNMVNYNSIKQCAPFGMANPKPLFLFENIVVETVKTFGKTKNHLELTFKDADQRTVRAIMFFKTPEDFEVKLVSGVTINLYAHFDFSFFAGRSELRLRIVDLHS